jgi:hypothetical protein
VKTRHWARFSGRRGSGGCAVSKQVPSGIARLFLGREHRWMTLSDRLRSALVVVVVKVVVVQDGSLR